MRNFRLTPLRAVAATLAYVLLWQTAIHALGWSGAWGLGLAGLYLVGLAWLVWFIERAAQAIEQRRDRGRTASDVLTGRHAPAQKRIWNPLDPEACYYGRHSQRFTQTLLLLGIYSLAFFALHVLVTLPSAGGPGGALAPHELPEGGGSDQIAGRTVQIQKVVTKKFVINPYSSIVFNVPEIDTIDLKILDLTKNQYQAGQTGISGEGGDGTGTGSGGTGSGSGSGSGFGSGTGTGAIRFVRLRHADRGWDKNFGIGGDLNMLNEYGARTNHKIGKETESLEIPQLASFEPKKAPPFVFVAGFQTFALSAHEKKVLRQYLLEQRGMIFADNLGGRSFHNQFFATMREVTGVQEVPIPRDDYIHRRLYPLPSLPIVVAHGGTVPYGWNVDGRWVVYYHPGAISDAWRDDHAGIKREIWEDCYRLGINVMFYAGQEKHKWLESRRPQ